MVTERLRRDAAVGQNLLDTVRALQSAIQNHAQNLIGTVEHDEPSTVEVVRAALRPIDAHREANGRAGAASTGAPDPVEAARGAFEVEGAGSRGLGIGVASRPGGPPGLAPRLPSRRPRPARPPAACLEAARAPDPGRSLAPRPRSAAPTGIGRLEASRPASRRSRRGRAPRRTSVRLRGLIRRHAPIGRRAPGRRATGSRARRRSRRAIARRRGDRRRRSRAG